MADIIKKNEPIKRNDDEMNLSKETMKKWTYQKKR
jgi:hypothetical protein